MKNGHLDQGGNITRKDTLIFPKDKAKVNEFYKQKNNRIKLESRNDFNKNYSN